MTLESKSKNKKHNPHGPRGERCSPTPTWFAPPTDLTSPPPPLSPWPSALPLPPLLPYHPLHPSVHSTAASLPPAPYRAPPSVPPLHQHSMTLPHLVTSSLPLCTPCQPRPRQQAGGWRARSAIHRWCVPPAQRCSTSLFLHAGANRIARLIVFRLQASTAFSCLINVWLIVFFYCRALPIQVCFGFTDAY